MAPVPTSHLYPITPVHRHLCSITPVPHTPSHLCTHHTCAHITPVPHHTCAHITPVHTSHLYPHHTCAHITPVPNHTCAHITPVHTSHLCPHHTCAHITHVPHHTCARSQLCPHHTRAPRIAPTRPTFDADVLLAEAGVGQHAQAEQLLAGDVIVRHLRRPAVDDDHRRRADPLAAAPERHRARVVRAPIAGADRARQRHVVADRHERVVRRHPCNATTVRSRRRFAITSLVRREKTRRRVVILKRVGK